MDLKSIIKNTKQTLTIIHLNDIRFGYFMLGNNEISFLGDEVSEFIKPNGQINPTDKCIGITIDGDMAVLNTLFLSPPGKNKIDCTTLDSVKFFELFDVILPAINITSFELFDMSFKKLKSCNLRLAGIGFFLNNRTFYEKYGFKNETHSAEKAKEEIKNLRDTATLDDLNTTLITLPSTIIKSKVRGEEFSFPPKTNDILTEIDKLITSDDFYKDKLKEMPLEYFIRNYLIPICEGKSDIGTSTYPLINDIVEDINLFLKTKGFNNFAFIKEYPEVDVKPKILVEPDELVEKILNIYINTNKEGGGKSRNRKSINRKSRKSRNSRNRKSRKSRNRKSRNRKSRKSKNRKK